MYALNVAAYGGESHLASSANIYNELARTRPDLIEVLAKDDWIFDECVFLPPPPCQPLLTTPPPTGSGKANTIPAPSSSTSPRTARPSNSPAALSPARISPRTTPPSRP